MCLMKENRITLFQHTKYFLLLSTYRDIRIYIYH